MPERVHQVVTPSVPGDPFLFLRMTINDVMSRPYEMTVDLLSEKTDIKATDLLGQSLTVSMRLPEEKTRYFHGLVSQFWNLGRRGTFAYYRAVARPALWYLSRAADCRIFQNKTAMDIVQEVCQRVAEIKLSPLVSGPHAQREYCVQYRESDLDFVHRLLEEEGIYYFFRHAEESHEVVLCDSSSQHAPGEFGSDIPFRAPGEAAVGLEHIARWVARSEVHSGAYVLDDYNFTMPRSEIQVRSARSRGHKQDNHEVYDYPGRYMQTSEGNPFIKARLEEWQCQHLVYEGTGDHRGLAVGRLFNLLDHPRESENRQYLLIEATIEIESGEIEQFGATENRFAAQFRAIPSDEQYRPPRITPKGRVHGPHTAKVVGPEGKEIWTDQYGRVKVKFHWDRREAEDENSSCWIRVAQTWAGQNWGAMHIPRVGQEVIVDFLEGDPDRPIITGRVYNADNMPPHKLPDLQNLSVIMSRSTPNGTANNFNELRFDDTKDAELVYFHAEKDFTRIVENNDVLKIGFDKKEQGDQTIDIFNNQVVHIGTAEAADGSQTIVVFNNQDITVGTGDADDGSQKLTVWNNRTVTVENGNDTLSINKGDHSVTVAKGNQLVTVSQGNQETTISQGNHALTISAGESKTSAATCILLKVGSSSIKIEPAKITIQSPEIAIKGDGKIDVSSPLSSVTGNGALKLSGGVVKIN